MLEAGEENLKVPAWLIDVTLYHNRGNTTFVDEDSFYGDFFGLDDLFTEHPTVVNGMIDVYKTWIGDLGIDGFRIDTMKHVNDEFWQRFGPEVLAYAKSQGKQEFFMFGEVFDTTRPFTSQFTTRNKMQSVLDFLFQDAARNFASKGRPNNLGAFFRDDDWYTDADSNVYQLPTFLGNHDMGRIGFFVNADNEGAAETGAWWRETGSLMSLMYFAATQSSTTATSRVSPEQVATRWPARRCSRARSLSTWTTTSWAPTGPMRRTTSTPHIRSTPPSRGYPTWRRTNRRCGTGRTRTATPVTMPGSTRSPACCALLSNEYVVVLNNSESAKTAAIPTYVANGAFTKIYGDVRRARSRTATADSR